MNGVPPSVARQLVQGPLELAWIRLVHGRVVDCGGALEAHGLSALSSGDPLSAELPWTEAVSGPLPITMRAVGRADGDDRRSHVSAWNENGATMVMLVDGTVGAGDLVATFQRGNEDAFLRERLAGAERLRRGERRERGEALAALGYELVELGPDGQFHPTRPPAGWMRRLCGWESDGDVPGIAPGDPIDFLSTFLDEATAFFDGGSQEGSGSIAPRVLPSGVWTQVLEDEDGARSDVSFEAFAIVLSTGRTVVAVERLGVTHEKAQRALQKARDAELSYEGLAREMQVKEVLLHCIVHDLRGPLSTLVGSLSLLEGGTLTREERAEIIEIGLRQARRQDAMIRNVLDVFAAEMGDVTAFESDPARAPDLALVAREVVERQRPAFTADGVELVLSSPGGARPVIGRADRLERVLANLVGNAQRHAPEGTTVEVRVEPGPRGHDLLRVLDRGPGVPRELVEQLFDRFVQGGSGGAAGLGLYYVRMTVERWGGEVGYRPREGGGAEFFVELPRAGSGA